MQKTRFEGQLRLICAAVRPSKMLSGLIFGAAIAVAGCVDTSKATGGREVNEAVAFIRSPQGAVPPKGLELIEFGMSLNQVSEILTPTYDLYRDPLPDEGNVIGETFTYSENGEVKMAYLYYRDGEVFSVNFGYSAFGE